MRAPLGTAIELLVKLGDSIRVEQSLITVESDKASMEIPSSHAGFSIKTACSARPKCADSYHLCSV